MSMKAMQKQKQLSLKGLGKPGEDANPKGKMSKKGNFAKMLLKKKK